jgi:hypothetical protein
MEFIKRLRNKTENEKKAIAFGVSLAITLFIAVAWLLARTALQGI